MSTTEESRPVATFKVKGIEYRLVTTDMWDFEQGLLAQQLSGGLSVGEIETRFGLADPSAGLAVLVLSILAVRPRTQIDEIRKEVLGENIAEIYRALKESIEAFPVTEPGQPPEPSLPSSVADERDTETIPEASGLPSSETSSA